MSRLIDMTGKRFGRLTVISRASNINGKISAWTCRCDCGTIKVVRGYDLRSGGTKSCGCYRRDAMVKASTHHGMSDTRLYRIWCDIKNRCYSSKVPNYSNYGGRGIRVCDDWMDPSKFFEWAKQSGYSDDLTIERIDIDGDYTPSNCKWITLSEQQFNKTTSRIIEINGESKCLREWCVVYDMPYKTVHHRINNLGWEPLVALTTPVRKHKDYEYRKRVIANG